MKRYESYGVSLEVVVTEGARETFRWVKAHRRWWCNISQMELYQEITRMAIKDIVFTDHRRFEDIIMIYDKMFCYKVEQAKNGNPRRILDQWELRGPMEYRPWGVYDTTGWELYPLDCKHQAGLYSQGESYDDKDDAWADAIDQYVKEKPAKVKVKKK